MRHRACLAVVLLALCSVNAPAARGISVTVKPDVVYREMRGSLTRLNFDVEIHNGSDDALRLFEIELRVFDEDDRILTRRYMGGNGLPGPIAMLPDADVDAGQSLYVFNPFPDLALERPAARAGLRLFHSQGRTEFDIDLAAPPADVRLARPPLNGISFIYSGNDLLAHHRRVSLNSEPARALDMQHVAQRFALDFTILDPRTGDLASAQGRDPSYWHAYDAEVYAPVDGRIEFARGEMPDNAFDDRGTRVFADGFENFGADAGLGNYVVIDIGGAFLIMSHFRHRTLAVEAGDEVRSGDYLGRIGMSGDTAYPHLHIQLQDSPDALAARPLPTTFACVTRNGAERANAAVDSGDFVAPCDAETRGE